MRIFKRGDELSKIHTQINELIQRVKRIENNIRSLKLRKIEWKDLKVGVFIDVQNMFYAAKNQFEARLDYVKTLQHILKGRRLIKAIAYIIENPEIDQSAFVSLLSHHSFEVRSKPLIQRADGSQKGDWDMEIALDILEFIDRVDVVALVSGDGDFVSLAKLVKSKGPRVEVYGFPQNTAIDLKEVADEFFPIKGELMFKQ